MNSSQQIVKSIEPVVQSQLKLSKKFKIIDKQFESYQRFLEYIDPEEDQIQEIVKIVRTPLINMDRMTIELGEKQLMDKQHAKDLDVVVAQMLELMQRLDTMMDIDSDSLRMLVKSGLMIFAKLIREKLMKMKHNCISKVS